MQCCMCENKKPLKREFITKKYVFGGLDNVTLIGVECYRCDVCGEEYYGYGNIVELHKLIANTLIKKQGLLTGKEIRFLRKYFGLSGAMFAELLGYEKETIYRIESEKQSFAPGFDRLVRFFVSSRLPDRDYELHDLILNKKLQNIRRIEIKRTKKGDWELKKAA